MALAASSFLIAAESDSPGDLRVMSYNIRYGTAKDGENHWDKRKDFLAETIKAANPDLLGTQETLGFQRDFLAETLPNYEVPAWVFHGAKDTSVPLKRSEEMVEALKAAGGDPKFTVYPEVGHDSWTATYENPDFYEWLLAQKRSKR